MNARWYWAIGALALISVILRQELLFLICIILGLVAGASALWTRYCLVEVSYRRRFGSKRLYFGEETDLRVEITNAKPLPLAWLRADDSLPAAMPVLSLQTEEDEESERRQLVNVLSLRWYERVTRRYRVRGIQRGEWGFGPAQLRSGDLFGFNIQRAMLEEIDNVIVFPRIVPITQLGLPARYPFGDFRMPRRLVEDPMRMMGVREYVQGDNFRHIHWKATARRQALQTKVFEPSANRPVALFLNISTAEYYYQGFNTELREYAITAAASLAQQIWEDGQPVGLLCNAHSPRTARYVRIPPRNHPSQLIQILTALAQINEGHGRWPPETLLPLEATTLPHGTTIVLITAVLTKKIEQTLLDLRRREYGVAVIALGKAQLSAPLPNVHYYHIGGEERWHDILSSNGAALELA
ncbi:MAG: DUF58 domain-containing protein [Caldilineaceae bacterium]